jgi:hypothetical protein
MVQGYIARGISFTAHVAVAMVAVVAGMGAVASGAEARRHASRVSRSRLGDEPSVLIHDTVLARHRLNVRDVPPDAYGGD